MLADLLRHIFRIELECVFFSVTPYPAKRSMMAFA